MCESEILSHCLLFFMQTTCLHMGQTSVPGEVILDRQFGTGNLFYQ